MQQSERERVRKINAHHETIYRYADEKFFPELGICKKERSAYPWETKLAGNYMRINKEFFRCPGRTTNPIRSAKGEDFLDCSGVQEHSLPTRDGKEFVYPILIDLLNYVQEKTGRKVIITCGHRCPAHNQYVEGAAHSKHLIAAEVDFYVEGMAHHPEEIIALLMRFYREQELYANQSPYMSFSLCSSNPRRITHPGWYNKEVILRIFNKDEGRDRDNSHAFPYLNIEVRFDKEAQKQVHYNWAYAHKSLLRW